MKETRKPRRSRRASQPAARGDRSVQAAHPAWRRHAWRMLALWALVLAAYSNSFQSGLVFDNAMAITQDARIRAVTPQNLRLILTERYWHGNTTSGLYRPLTTSSYLLNYAVFGNGTHPAGYHWVNLALHGVNVSLVYLLGILVLGARRAGLGPGSALGTASAAHRIRHQCCGPRRPAGRLRRAGRLAVLREERLRHRAAQAALGGGHAGRPGGRDLFQGECRRPARYHAPIRPDVAKARGVAGARAGLRRPGAAVGRVFLFARRIADAYSGALRRQSPDERRFLDGAAHGHQSNRQVSVAVCLAGPLVGGLFL